METTPCQTSGTRSSGTKAPIDCASIGMVDSPPPTKQSKPGPYSGWLVPTKDTSWISCVTSRRALPEAAGRLWQHRVGASPAADEAIKARAIFWVVSADKGHVLDLMRHALAGVAGNSRLKLARQVVCGLAVKIFVNDGLCRRGGVNNF